MTEALPTVTRAPTGTFRVSLPPSAISLAKKLRPLGRRICTQQAPEVERVTRRSPVAAACDWARAFSAAAFSAAAFSAAAFSAAAFSAAAFSAAAFSAAACSAAVFS